MVPRLVTGSASVNYGSTVFDAWNNSSRDGLYNSDKYIYIYILKNQNLKHKLNNFQVQVLIKTQILYFWVQLGQVPHLHPGGNPRWTKGSSNSHLSIIINPLPKFRAFIIAPYFLIIRG